MIRRAIATALGGLAGLADHASRLALRDRLYDAGNRFDPVAAIDAFDTVSDALLPRFQKDS